MGTICRSYRLAYNLAAVISLLPVVALVGLLPGRTLYRVPFPWILVLLIVQIAALAIISTGFLQVGAENVEIESGPTVGRISQSATGEGFWGEVPGDPPGFVPTKPARFRKTSG